MADEEPVDPKKYLEESCKPKCVKPLLEYRACIKRIEGDETGHKHCTGQYFDYWGCVDKCLSWGSLFERHLCFLATAYLEVTNRGNLDFLQTGLILGYTERNHDVVEVAPKLFQKLK